MRLLVTGNLGFIGTNLTFHLLKLGYDVVGVDKISYCSNKKALMLMEKFRNFRFVRGDITNKSLMLKLVKDSDVVLHLAAESHVDNSIVNPLPFLRNNVLGMFSVLEGVRKNKRLLIHFSSDEVYGEILRGEVDENSNFNAGNPYSATKVFEEALVNSYVNTFGVKAVVLRPCNVFGYWQFPEKFIPKIITNALTGKKIPVYGNGLQIREWLFIDDLCSFVGLLLSRGVESGVFNVGSGVRKRNIDVVKKILKLLSKNFSLIDFVDDRLGHDRRYAIDSSKARKFGWKPRFSFDDGLRRTVSWYGKNLKLFK